MAFITYSFAYLDRSNYSIGSAGGLTTSLHLSSTQSGLLGGLFFIGYFLFQVPAGTFAERRSVKTLLFWSLCAWGVFAALQGVITTYWLLLADRFLLGVVEAVVLPAMLVFVAHWFTKAERGRADTLLILGNPVTLMWMSVVSGYLIDAVGYRWMFIIEGLPAIAWAFVFRRLLTAVPYAAAVIAMVVVSAVSDRSARRRVFTWIPLLIAALCFAVSYLTRGGTFTVSFILLIVAAAAMYAAYGPYFAYIPELFPADDAAPATGMVNAFGALGGFVGTYIVGALGGARRLRRSCSWPVACS